MADGYHTTQAFEPAKPVDLQLLDAVAARFQVEAVVAQAWLKQIDHKAVAEAIATRGR